MRAPKNGLLKGSRTGVCVCLCSEEEEEENGEGQFRMRVRSLRGKWKKCVRSGGGEKQ